ncbi:MAG: hypothetical protein JJU21_13035 [Salinarimonas sp.]|nr:hypothetical protein [Salinarimonas sp.]
MMRVSGHEQLPQGAASAGANRSDRPLAIPGRLLRLALVGSLLALAPAVSDGLVTAAQAQESAWDEGHASRARLIAGAGDGENVMAGIEIELADGYKTYWRHAGDSGLPPEIDWEGSQNVADLTMEFPAPKRLRDASGTFFGYEDAVILPLTITPRDPEEPVSLEINLSYGVCKDICIPAFADIALTIPALQSGSHAPRIARALTEVPRRVDPGERYAGLAIHDHAPTDDGRLAITVEAPDDALLMAEGPDYRWFLDPSESAQPDSAGRMVFAVEIADAPRMIEGPARFRFTLTGGGGAIETVFELPRALLQELAGH